MAGNNYGRPNMGLSCQGNDAIIHDSRAHPGYSNVFTVQKQTDTKTFWKFTGTYVLRAVCFLFSLSFSGESIAESI